MIWSNKYRIVSEIAEKDTLSSTKKNTFEHNSFQVVTCTVRRIWTDNSSPVLSTIAVYHICTFVAIHLEVLSMRQVGSQFHHLIVASVRGATRAVPNYSEVSRPHSWRLPWSGGGGGGAHFILAPQPRTASVEAWSLVLIVVECNKQTREMEVLPCPVSVDFTNGGGECDKKIITMTYLNVLF